MILRPAVAALSCRSCQGAVFQAVLATSPKAFRYIPQRRIQQSPPTGARCFSSEQSTRPDIAVQSNRTEERLDVQDATPESEPSDKPWFLQVLPPRQPSSQHSPPLPKTPEGAPGVVEPLIKYVWEDMGLDDLALLDLRDLNPPAALGPNLIMLFGTTRSERHLHVSAGRFVRWLHRNHGLGARADGLIGAGELKTKLRRLRKKAKLMGNNTAMVPGGDNGISTGWVCVNFTVGGDNNGEAASFDDSGKFSGFGTPQNETTIVIQCMTESRRRDLDLETLWRGILKRSLEQDQKVKGKSVENKEELDALVSKKLQLSPAAAQWQALQLASQSQAQRHFSTAARRLSSAAAVESPRVETPPIETGWSAWDELCRQVSDVQVLGSSLTGDNLGNLISAVLQTPASSDVPVSYRLQLVDEILLTAEERGISLWSRHLLVSLIESVLYSAAYGEDLQRAQKNLEFLLNEIQFPLENAQILRLMAAYAHRAAWDRFWDVFCMPPRFKIARSVEQYELAFRTMAASGDRAMCADALRWVYPEMLSEQLPVLPTGAVYSSLKACILVADPSAETLLHHPPAAATMDLFEQRKLKNREMVRLLREVEKVRGHAERGEAVGRRV